MLYAMVDKDIYIINCKSTKNQQSLVEVVSEGGRSTMEESDLDLQVIRILSRSENIFWISARPQREKGNTPQRPSYQKVPHVKIDSAED